MPHYQISVSNVIEADTESDAMDSFAEYVCDADVEYTAVEVDENGSLLNPDPDVLYTAILVLCQDYGTTSTATEDLIREVIGSINTML